MKCECIMCADTVVGWVGVFFVSAALFLMGRVMPEASSRLVFSNICTPPMLAEWMTNENMKGKTGRRGRKQEPEWLTGEDRGQEKERDIMMSRKDKVTRGEGEK